ncbi:(E2-independent) E3 ubiquitin-conjugating enzyme FATS-like isoform X1 [Acipenser ruthenus]|uniref:(E2-independent) E3 ubiquitin-conjugating enzyme FATS-like isoform X1 n=1 Tax=Acipenser ruthenus TaxID=7906 RepID=UPI001560BD90|nr:(E2-independent) E3 ubiquitin-conjugating enzyme FATS-like isoform X1 [Acipenser ruthenus]
MQMERLLKQSTGAPPVIKIPPLSVRTVSLPELYNDGIVLAPRQREILESTPHYFPPSRRWSFTSAKSACSEDTSGGSVTPISKGCLEKARLRCTARKERVVFCTMETVNRGWLPMQKKAATYVIHSDKEQKETAAATREKVNSSPMRNNLDHKHTPRNKDNISTGLRFEGFPFKGTADIRKAFIKEKVGLLENSLPAPIGGYFQDLQGNRTALSLFQPDLIHSDNPHRKECAAPCMSPSLPAEQPRTIGILRTSRENVCQTNSAHMKSKADLSKMRPGFSSITIAARRVTTPASRPPETTPDSCLKHTEGALPLNAVDPVVTVDRPSIGRHCKPVLRNRKATIIKVTEYRHRYSYTESGRKARVPEHRHSYTEGENKENAYSHLREEGDRRGSSASSSQGLVRSSTHYKVPAESANAVLYLDKSLSFSIHKPERNTVPQVHRSALSLYLNSSSPKETLDGGSGKTNENYLPGPKPTGNSSRVSDNTEMNQETSTVPPLNQNGLTPQKHSCVDGIWGIASQSSAQSRAAALTKGALCVLAPQIDKQEHQFNYETSKHRNNFRILHLDDGQGLQTSSYPNRKQTADQGVGSFASLPEQDALKRGSPPTGDYLLKGNYCSAVTVTAQAKLQTQLVYQIPDSPEAVLARDSKAFSKITWDTFDDIKSLGKVSDCEKEDIRQQSTPSMITEHTRNPGKPNQCVQSHTDLEDGSRTTLTLREALELLRPDFITRSRERVQQLELRALQRRAEQSERVSPPPGIPSSTANRKRQCTRPHPLSDNLFKPKERTIPGKEMQLRSKRIYKQLPEVKRRKEEEQKKVVSQTNRLRAELFKKKLLDQILQRSID